MYRSLTTTFIQNPGKWVENLIVGGYYSRECPIGLLKFLQWVKDMASEQRSPLACRHFLLGQQRELGRMYFSKGPRTSSRSKKPIVYNSLWPHPYPPLIQDKWGWRRTWIYTIAQGFSSLQSTHAPSLTPKLWKIVWSPFSLQVNFFTWLLMHRKALTSENLNKRGFRSLFRCCLCNSATETFDHLLVDCDFTQAVWNLVHHGLSAPSPS